MRNFSIAIPGNLNQQLCEYLIRDDVEEDLLFVLWHYSNGSLRDTALVQELILPIEGDRQRHGNASFNPQYIKRVNKIAAEKKCGVGLIHSHVGPGWQGMSDDDIVAEKDRLSETVDVITGFPLLGMTVGTDGTWSGRRWLHNISKGDYEIQWAESVRSVGPYLKVDYNDHLIRTPKFSELFKRTRAVWGKNNHEKLAKLRIGIIGLGSVGSLVAENLARMGMEKFVLIDFDKVEPHNLDRLSGATRLDIGKYKVDVAKRQIETATTAEKLEIDVCRESLYSQEGYTMALNCDVVFSCVDRPRARYILNHLAYSHLIPVIDGGIQVRFEGTEEKGFEFEGADWQLQTVCPSRPCLQCLDVYSTADVSLEKTGQLDDPSYIKGLPKDNYNKKNNENIFPFSSNLASLEIFQLVALVTGAGGMDSFGIQRFRYVPGIISRYNDKSCDPNCTYIAGTATGDKFFKPI